MSGEARRQREPVLGACVGLLLIVEVALLTGNAVGRWHFPAHGLLTLMPLYVIFAMLALWVMANERRGLKQLKVIAEGRGGGSGRAGLDTTRVLAIQAENRLWATKVLACCVPFVILVNVRMDLTRYTVSPWLESGFAMVVLFALSLQGLSHRKMWWDDPMGDEIRRLRIEAGETVDEEDDPMQLLV